MYTAIQPQCIQLYSYNVYNYTATTTVTITVTVKSPVITKALSFGIYLHLYDIVYMTLFDIAYVAFPLQFLVIFPNLL